MGGIHNVPANCHPDCMGGIHNVPANCHPDCMGGIHNVPANCHPDCMGGIHNVPANCHPDCMGGIHNVPANCHPDCMGGIHNVPANCHPSPATVTNRSSCCILGLHADIPTAQWLCILWVPHSYPPPLTPPPPPTHTSTKKERSSCCIMPIYGGHFVHPSFPINTKNCITLVYTHFCVYPLRTVSWHTLSVMVIQSIPHGKHHCRIL